MSFVKADFSIAFTTPKVVGIIDGDGAMSITNDAENVVSWLTDREFIRPGIRLVYRDTTGMWDELLHDGQGVFLGFKHLGAKTEGEVRAFAES